MLSSPSFGQIMGMMVNAGATATVIVTIFAVLRPAHAVPLYVRKILDLIAKPMAMTLRSLNGRFLLQVNSENNEK